MQQQCAKGDGIMIAAKGDDWAPPGSAPITENPIPPRMPNNVRVPNIRPRIRFLPGSLERPGAVRDVAECPADHQDHQRARSRAIEARNARSNMAVPIPQSGPCRASSTSAAGRIGTPLIAHGACEQLGRDGGEIGEHDQPSDRSDLERELPGQVGREIDPTGTDHSPRTQATAATGRLGAWPIMFPDPSSRAPFRRRLAPGHAVSMTLAALRRRAGHLQASNAARARA